MIRSGLFRMQFSRLLTRKECKISFALSMGFVTAAFLEECISFYGKDQSMQLSASYGWVGNINTLMGNVMQIFYLFGICLVASLAFSCSFLEDKKNHSIVAILGRNTWEGYWKTGAILSLVGGFFVVFIPLVLSQLLSFLIFPASGGLITNNVGVNEWDMPVELIQGVYVFPRLILNYPYLSNFVFIIVSSLFAGFNATISYLISLFGVRNKILILGVPALFWIVYNVVITFINSKLIYQIYLYPDYSVFKEPWFFFVLPLSLLLVILAGCLAVQKRKKEAVLI